MAIRSRNQRSWLMTTAQPPKSTSASSSARSMSTSRSLVGSSSSSRLPPLLSSLARWTRFRSPPERLPTFFSWSGPLKLNGGHVGPCRYLALAQDDRVDAAGDLLEDRVLGLEGVAVLIDVGDHHRVADPKDAAIGRLLADDHAEERGLARAVGADDADDAAGRQAEVHFFEQEPIAVGLGETLGLDDQRAQVRSGRNLEHDRLVALVGFLAASCSYRCSLARFLATRAAATSAPTRARGPVACGGRSPASPRAPAGPASARATTSNSLPRECPGRGRARGSTWPRCRGSSGRG